MNISLNLKKTDFNNVHIQKNLIFAILMYSKENLRKLTNLNENFKNFSISEKNSKSESEKLNICAEIAIKNLNYIREYYNVSIYNEEHCLYTAFKNLCDFEEEELQNEQKLIFQINKSKKFFNVIIKNFKFTLL